MAHQTPQGIHHDRSALPAPLYPHTPHLIEAAAKEKYIAEPSAENLKAVFESGSTSGTNGDKFKAARRAVVAANEKLFETALPVIITIRRRLLEIAITEHAALESQEKSAAEKFAVEFFPSVTLHLVAKFATGFNPLAVTPGFNSVRTALGELAPLIFVE